MPLTYRRVKDVYDQLRDAGVVTQSLPEWSAEMDRARGTNLYSAGLEDNWIKRANVGLDRMLEATGLPARLEEVGGRVGSWVDNEEVGRTVGHGMLRSAVNFLPIMRAGSLLTRLGGTAALSGSDVYTQTGSPGAGVVAGTISAAMPGVAGLAERSVLRGMGVKPIVGRITPNPLTPEITEAVKRYIPESVKQGVLSQLAGQTTAAGLGEVGSMLQAGLDENQDYNFSPSSMLLNATLGQVPFTALYLSKGGRVPFGGKAAQEARTKLEANILATEARLKFEEAQEAAKQRTPLEHLPKVTQPTEVNLKLMADTNRRLQEIRGQMREAMREPDKEDVDAVARLRQEEAELLRSAQGHYDGSGIAGVKMVPETKRTTIVGTQHFHNPRTGFRMVKTPDGRIVGYSTLHEPHPVPSKQFPGQFEYSVPEGFWSDFKDNRPVRGQDLTQPELPVGAEATGYFDHVAALQQAEAKLDAAKTEADMQQAIVDYNATRMLHGMPPHADADALMRAKKFSKEGDLRTGYRSLINKTRRELDQQSNTLRRSTGMIMPTSEQGAQVSTEPGTTGTGRVGRTQQATQPVLPEMAPETGPIHDIFDQLLSAPKLVQDAEQSFKLWQAQGSPDRTDLGMEHRRYKVFARLRAMKEIAKSDVLSDADAEHLWRELSPEIRPPTADMLKDFPERDHVLNWDDAVQLHQDVRGGSAAGRIKLLSDKGKPILGIHRSSTPFKLQEYDLSRHGEHGATDFGPGIYLDVGAGWDDYGPHQQRTYIDANARVLDETEGPNNTIQQIADKFENGPYDVLIHRNVLEGKESISQVVVKHPKFLVPEGTEQRAPAPHIPAGEGWVGDPSRAPKGWDKIDPTTMTMTESEAAAKVGQDGASVLDFVESVVPTDSWMYALARDLRKFPELLKRTGVRLVASDQPSAARMNPWTRAGEITFSRDFLNAPPETQAIIALHEVVHQQTLAELENPMKKVHVEALEDLRNQLRDGLSKEHKALLEQAERTGFLQRWGAGEADFSELGPHAEILYGLLNKKEFVTQGLTSHKMREFLRNSKTGIKQGLWHKFMNLVRSIAGFDNKRVTGTAWDFFLNKTSRIVEQGEGVATFHNFMERYLENQGYSRENAQAASAVGAGLALHNTMFPLDAKTMAEALLRNDLPNPITTAASRALQNMYRSGGDEFKSHAAVMQELGYDVNLKGLTDLVTDVMNGDVNGTLALEVSPKPVTDWVFAKLHDMRDMMEALQAASDPRNKAFMAFEGAEGLQKATKDISRKINRAMASEKLHQTGLNIIRSLSAVEPSGFWQKWNNPEEQEAGGASAAPFFNNRSDEPPRTMWQRFKDWIGPTAQHEDPMAREAFSKGYQLEPNIRKMKMEDTKIFGLNVDTGKIEGETVKGLEKAVKDPKVQKALNSWIYEEQVAGGDKVVALPQTDPRVEQHMKGLTKTQIDQVNDLKQRRGFSKRSHDQQVLEKFEQESVTRGGGLLNRFTDLKIADNIALSEGLWKALRTDWNDPAQAAVGEAQLAKLQELMTPEAFNALLEQHQGSLESYKLMKQHFDDNPEWASAQRVGKYRVEFFNKNGKLEVQGVDSKREAEHVAGGRNKVHRFYEAKRQGDEDVPHFGSDMNQVFDRIRQIEENQRAKWRALGVDADVLQDMEENPVFQQLARETTGQGLKVPGAPPRQLSRGAENVPYFSNHFSWLDRGARYWSRRLFRAQMDAYIGQKEMPEHLKQQLRTHRDNMLQADPDGVNKFNNFVRTWFMGFHPANVIINAVQPFMTHVAELTALTGKILGSYKRVMDALKEVGGTKWGNKEWSSPELKKFMTDAAHDGEVRHSAFDLDVTAREAAATNLKRTINGERPRSLGQHMQSWLAGATRAGMWMFEHGEQVNNQSALIASFKLFREMGDSYDVAKQKAYDFNHRVNFGGGRAQRGVGAFSSRSPVLRGAAMLATAMQSYVLGTTFQLARYLKAGGFRPKGLTPHEVHSARKAAIIMLGTQLAAAGLLGLPFVSGAISLLDKSFPGLEVNKNLREGVQSLFGEDDENGGLLTDMAMTGVPSMLGWDMQSRLSMGNTLPGVSEVNGFQPENLLGPPANLVANFVEGGRKLLQGDTKGARAFVPSALKKMTDLFLGEGKLEDYKGRELLDPTPGESVGVMLGFQPKRLSDLNAARRMAELSESNESKREGTFRQEMAEETLRGNIGTVKAELRQRLNADPAFDVREAVHGIARAVEEQSFPRDLRREGGSDTRSRLLQSFGLVDLPAKASETSRLNLRARIIQMFDRGYSPGRQEIALAQLMDQISQQEPSLTRREVRRIAERQVRLYTPTLSLE